MPKRFLKGFAFVFAVTLACLAGAEAPFRTILFSDIPQGARFRRAHFYANSFSEDAYWLLHRRFASEPFEYTHPLLGWIGAFDGEDLRHAHADSLLDRRPVLLYGDSFARVH